MIRTYMYIPEQLDEKIIQAAREQKISKAAVIRQALTKGLKTEEKKYGGAEILLEIAKIAKKYDVKGPKDASRNLDHYLWGFPKKNK